MDYVAEQATEQDCPNGIVVNMSLGGGKSAAVNEGAAAMVDAGLFVAIAAGNCDAFGNPQDISTVSPASEPSVCTVGATDKSDAVASFSNYGDLLDVYARRRRPQHHPRRRHRHLRRHLHGYPLTSLASALTSLALALRPRLACASTLLVLPWKASSAVCLVVRLISLPRTARLRLFAGHFLGKGGSCPVKGRQAIVSGVRRKGHRKC